MMIQLTMNFIGSHLIRFCADWYEYGHILEEKKVTLHSLRAGMHLEISMEIPAGWFLDWVIWKFQEPSIDNKNPRQLLMGKKWHMSPYFLWGSHTRIERPADVYSHLIYGHVYENRNQWPNFWRIPSENDAHALYVVLSGLWKSTQMALYDWLRCQLVCAVLDRQSADGAWRHGEWSNEMEVHYRMHVSGMHLLMDYLEEHKNPSAENGLKRAAEFLIHKTDKVAGHTWFYHDELELTHDRMSKSPFRWSSSRIYGKSESNMLVLNTQLDATIALDRYATITGDDRFQKIVASARKATDSVIRLRTAEYLYKVLFGTMRLTLLPNDLARDLPLMVRALKRVGWKYLARYWAPIKTRFPRLVMPGGYIDRDLCISGLSDAYLSINLMDLCRYSRCFDDKYIYQTAEAGFGFGDQTHILDQWAENVKKRYSIGFWGEALYARYLASTEHRLLDQLADVVFRQTVLELGLSPSFLGSNGEAVHISDQKPCPILDNSSLRVVNLSRRDANEYLVVNSSEQDLAMDWIRAPIGTHQYIDRTGFPRNSVPARGWLLLKQLGNRID